MRTTQSLSVLALAALLTAPITPAAAGQEKDQDQPPKEQSPQQEQEAAQEHEAAKQAHREEMERRMAMRRTQQQTPGQGETVDISIPVQEMSPGELAAQPRLHYGGVVQVSAEIESVFGKQTFTLDEDRIGTGPDVLVVLPREPAAEIPEGERVRVVGHVRPLVMTEFERDYDWFDFDLFGTWYDERELEAETRMRPVVIASSITTEDGRELLGAEAAGTVRTDVPTERPRTDRPGMQAPMGQPEQWDMNNDNRIGSEEWTDAHFSIWDDDNDTLLNESEWNEVTDSDAFAGIDTGEFSDWDLNNDDVLDQDEFGTWIEENAWNEWDQDGDGFLSFDEAGLI